MSKYIPRTQMNTRSQVPNDISVYFHRHNLLKIQEALGTKCTFLSHVSYPKFELQEIKNEMGEVKEGMFKRVETGTQYGVIAKFGKAKPILAMLNGTPDDIKSEYYSQLRNDIANAARKRGLL